MVPFHYIHLLGWLALAAALPSQIIESLETRQLNTGHLLSGYVPTAATCPSGFQVRQANGALSSDESSWIASRKSNADAALGQWLTKVGSFGKPNDYPVVGLATSGGGLRATLIGAGVHQAFDARDSPNTMGGIYQALTYESGLSGGAWLLGSVSGNNYPTITDLAKKLWYNTFSNSLLLPDNLLVIAPLASIVVDVTTKGLAGFGANVVDLYGRLLGYMLLQGNDGGVSTTMSAVLQKSMFINHQVPFPIVTAVANDLTLGYCNPGKQGYQFELSPLEFGSWDQGVNAFVTSKYLGSNMNKGAPAKAGACMINFDNVGYAMGASSNIFNSLCVPSPSSNDSQMILGLKGVLSTIHTGISEGLFATVPNPFSNYAGSPGVSHLGDLTLIDGGSTGQNNPIWPMLHRKVDVLFISDSTSGPGNFPGGDQLYNTYTQDRQQGINRMPEIPQDIDTTKPSFIGCNDPSKLTIIYLPDRPYTYNSGTPQGQVQYPVEQTKAMIANGVATATYNGTAGWDVCVGCAIMKKAGTSLDGACSSCFAEHCVN